MDCELCGARNAFQRVRVEGTILNVCGKCADAGERIDAPRKFTGVPKKAALPEELEQAYVSGFANIIKRAREAKGMTQDQLAEKARVRASFVRRMEEGWEAPLDIAARVERILGVKLTEKAEAKSGTKAEKAEPMTIGDLVEVKE